MNGIMKNREIKKIIVREELRIFYKEIINNVIWKIDCEIDCMQSGNKFTPFELSMAIKTVDNIKKRII